MPDYKAMYFRMAHETAKATDYLSEALDILVEVQKECEEMYINNGKRTGTRCSASHVKG